MLRQGDSDVFKRYSQAKLNMMREALAKLDRRRTSITRLLGHRVRNDAILEQFWNILAISGL